MSPVGKLKLRVSTILWLSLTAVISSIGIPLLLILIEDSNAFQYLKAGKPIDSIISMLSMPSLSIPVFAFALIIASIFLNFFLFKRMSLYYKAAEKFGECFYMVSLKYSKLTGTPVTINFKENEFVIDAKSHGSESVKKL